MASFLRFWKRNKPSPLAYVLALLALGGTVFYLSTRRQPSAPEGVEHIEHPQVYDSSRKHLNAIPNLSPNLKFRQVADKLRESADEIRRGMPDGRKLGDSRMEDDRKLSDGRKPGDLQGESVNNELNAVMAKLKNDKLFKRGMAEPEFLRQKAAVERQNSFLNMPRSKQQQQQQLDDFPNRQNLMKRQPADHFRATDLDSKEEEEKPKNFIELLNSKNKLAGGSLRDFDQGVKNRIPDRSRRRERPYKGIGVRGRERGGGYEGGLPGGNAQGRIPVLGSFDVEAYLAPQRLAKGTGDNMKKFQFNQEASDATPPDRYLKDYRHGLCQKSPEQYQSNLPTVSIIICFTNEARSALLRTIVSVLNRSPPELLEEIILIDDFSDDPSDGRLLAEIPKVRLFRMESREGLIRARIRGAREARGSVLLFLDSHCEAITGWLQPLLSRIKENRTVIVSPVIDIIDKDNMQYTVASPSVRGGFDNSLHFKWDSIPDDIMATRRSSIEPIQTPAIAGGLFAVDREWFHHIGDYDSRMDIWGAENVELSMRVWMCGGSMEIIPCSHVGHIFRSAIPYSFGPGGTYHNTVGKNIRRTVEVWLDEYKTYFYETNVYSRNIEFGDVSDRLALRRRLGCKSFRWYIDNVYPQFDAPPVQDFTYGRLILGGEGEGAGGLCLDSGNGFHNSVVEMRECNKEPLTLEDSQGWALMAHGGVKHGSLCMTVDLHQLRLTACSVKTNAAQQFRLLPSGLLYHAPSQKCLSELRPSASHPTLVDCDKSEQFPGPALNWEFRLTTPT